MFNNQFVVSVLVAIVASFGPADVLQGQEWARKMFTEYVHDFKEVNLGEKPEYRFKIKNIYKCILYNNIKKSLNYYNIYIIIRVEKN